MYIFYILDHFLVSSAIFTFCLFVCYGHINFLARKLNFYGEDWSYRVFFFNTQISFSPHFYTNKDIDMRSFVTCSRHRVVFLEIFSLLQI